MSQGNVDRTLQLIEAYNRRELPLEAFDPDVEWIEDARYPDAQTYHGPDGVQRSVEKWWEAWAAITLNVEEAVDAGDCVVIWGVSEAHGHEPGATIRAPFGGVWELRDGLVSRVRVLASREEALEAAGLPSSPG